MATGSSSDRVDAQLDAFLRGALTGDELDAFERQLDADPKLLERLAQRADPDKTEVSPDATVTAGAALARMQPAPTSTRLALGAELGQGGMARIVSGTQPALGRTVAVKMAPPNAEPGVSDQLLQEARLTGSLEHPGIVPIHDLLTDEAGQVQVVLKRIEGDVWATLILQPDEVRSRFGVDPIEWHLSVAVHLCRAMGFAHTRGVVHRDIKPSNVMIGRFGEVYLLDWGVAGTLTPDPTGLLPCIAAAPFAGTLNFMAPEQVWAQVPQIGPWTDTYLLGASLYVALYGMAPHRGSSVDARRATVTEPVSCAETQGISRELVGILQKALHPEPKQRYLTADALRVDLEAYLKHRDGRRLTERAKAQALLARLARDRGDRAGAERAAAEAEFGFRAALELWPDDTVARRLLDELGAGRVRSALDAGDVQGAARLLAALTAAPEQLKETVARAVAAEAAERDRLAQVDRDADRFVGLASKRWMLAGFGLAWWGFWWAMALWPPATALPLLGFFACYGGVGTVTVLVQRKVLLDQRKNREMFLVHLALVLASIALAAVAHAWALPMAQVFGLMMLLWSLAMAALAAIIEPASLIPAIVWMLGFVAAAIWPAALPAALMVGTVVHVGAPLAVSLRLRRDAVRASTKG